MKFASVGMFSVPFSFNIHDWNNLISSVLLRAVQRRSKHKFIFIKQYNVIVITLKTESI